ncbi:MAG: uroporphyrinogen decarboxylase family protein, partial [Candidatus Ratteibacteria bacterium]
GVDILDPVQVTAKKMDIETLAKKFKDKICFHGGIDTQKLLPYGTPKQVKNEVKKIIKLFECRRIFICPSQNFLPDIPVENLLAMYRAERTCD